MITVMFDERFVKNGGIATQDLVSGPRSSTRAEFVDQTSGEHVILRGGGFRFEHGVLTDGKIDKVIITDDNERLLQVISDFRLDAGNLQHGTPTLLVNSLFGKIVNRDIRALGSQANDLVATSIGDDILRGGHGRDTLSGQSGQDVLFGGSGNDTFVFQIDFGRDTIADFDADGGRGGQDHIDGEFPGAEALRRHGEHTLIDFGDGDRLILLHVRPHQVDATDFV